MKAWPTKEPKILIIFPSRQGENWSWWSDDSDLGISSSWMTNSSIRFSTTTSSSITCRTHLDPPVTARASFQSVKKTVTMNQIISSLCRLFTVATAHLTSKPKKSFRGEVVWDLHPLPSPNIKRVGQLNISRPKNFKGTSFLFKKRSFL